MNINSILWMNTRNKQGKKQVTEYYIQHGNIFLKPQNDILLTASYVWQNYCFKHSYDESSTQITTGFLTLSTIDAGANNCWLWEVVLGITGPLAAPWPLPRCQLQPSPSCDHPNCVQKWWNVPKEIKWPPYENSWGRDYP